MNNNLFTINNLWMMIATALVFIMHLGFATLETGLTRSKNTVNILFKNSIIPALGILTYTLWGFNMMYPGESFAGSFFGFSGFGVFTDAEGLTPIYNIGYTYWTDFLFQAMFAATAATIVSGAVAERIKLSSFLIFSTLFVGIVYPVVGMWKWGGGFLNELGFYDFAGSTIVHSVGGWGALTGVVFLGPRLGKFGKNKINPIPGHSMPLAVIGVFLLWLGWFGFNGGSVLSADPGLVSLVLVTTSLAASAGGVSAMISSWMYTKKPDITMVLNGILAGLVGITAGADLMGPLSSIIIGGISGSLVVFSVVFFDKMKLDDPVGAMSVHLVCGIFGTLAVGLFGSKAGLDQLWAQVIGIASTAVFVVISTSLMWYVLKKTMGIRVSELEEVEGLDFGEHAMEAYPEFEKVS
ncbi:MAG: ammonium transporter [Ignavibacteriae bacterium HGW-Ignavibacteriae-2]|nr:ammonium transporter [Bacteroidota bacterium]PKL90184.1 MAG: ammonium transporter [Ignavibacteriae bacterium HGW-Ignavibacteriae-2]